MRHIAILATLLHLLHVSYCQVTTKTTSNDVTSINLKINENLIQHHTSKYRQTVVLRRGASLNCDLYLSRTFDDADDRIRLEFSFGPYPDISRGTLFYIPILRNKTFSNKVWDAQLTGVEGNKLSVQVNIPASAPIGIWRFRITTKVANLKTLSTFNVPYIFYLLFNAWSENDSVYLADEDARQEYILNEIGKIYIGSPTRPAGRKWVYGQFHESVLPVIMYLLDQTHLDVLARGDPVKVARAVSAVLNSHDDMGLLVGEWNGHYRDGTAPWQWSDSTIIFDRYLRTRQPVRYAQCWVFAGVLTTALRTLGIPARTVTNYFSAHEKDKTLTVDKFYSETGQELKGMTQDTIWNFHVWSEAWMKRSDLPAGYDGWQVVDSTPQERSDKIFQLGPASLEAIKRGQVNLPYDVGFVFSEVNADLINWKRVRGRWQQTQRVPWHMGRRMLTKRIGVFGFDDAQDITALYKYPEGSREERLAYNEALKYISFNRPLGR